jgi:hypothetical protein
VEDALERELVWVVGVQGLKIDDDVAGVGVLDTGGFDDVDGLGEEQDAPAGVARLRHRQGVDGARLLVEARDGLEVAASQVPLGELQRPAAKVDRLARRNVAADKHQRTRKAAKAAHHVQNVALGVLGSQ